MPTSLNRARNKKNDEFYTRMLDIEEEMSHYDFTNKIIYCNCDNPATSNFYKFFRSNFDTLKLKKLIVTCLLTKQKVEYYGQDNLKVSYLNSYGDFRSADCLSALKEADCIVTNPPFSLFREFISLLIHNNKQFLVLGNINAVTYKEIFSLIMKNKIWLGYRQLNKDMYFDVPDGVQNWLIKNKKEGSAYKVVNNKVMGRLASACWFTNIDHAKRHQMLPLDLGFVYECHEDMYPKYDNYDAINVDKTAEISSDYTGVMGVPITFLDKYCPEQFEIVAFRKGEDGKDLVFTREMEREFNHTFVCLYDIDCREDKKCRRQNQWETYLCENNNQTQIEPIDYFFPNSMPINGCMNSPKDTAINGEKKYARVLIRYKLKDGDN